MSTPTKGAVIFIPELDEVWGDEALFKVLNPKWGIVVCIEPDNEGRVPSQVNFDATTWSSACEGHESLNGADMGKTVECDGSCRS